VGVPTVRTDPKARGVVMSKNVFRWVGIVLGSLLGLFLLAALILPFIVNVDKYRPQIIQAASDRINGKLELGKLSLSLWGRVKVQVDGFNLADAKGRTVLAAKDVYFDVPVWSLITGAPELLLKMKAPEVHVIKDKTGKLNALQLMKTQPSTDTAPPAASHPQGTDSQPSGGLPGIAVRARLGVELDDSHLTYRDEKTGLVSEVKDLNVRLKDVSLSHLMNLEVWANLDTRMGESLQVKGPARATAQANAKFFEGKFLEASLAVNVDLNSLEIRRPGTFEKKKGVSANANGVVKVSPEEATLEKLVIHFHNAEIAGSGKITHLDADAIKGESPELDLKFNSNLFALKPWTQLIPLLGQYDLGGTASMLVTLLGTTDVPKYRALLAVTDLTAKAPILKTQPVINARIAVMTDQVDSVVMTMRAPGNDLKISGRVVSFTRPKIDIQVSSSGMDLDQLIDFPKKPTGGGAPATASSKQTPPTTKEGASDLDASLTSLRQNKIAAATVANIKVGLALLKAYGVKITGINGQVSFRDLALALENFHLGVFGGKIGLGMGLQMRPKIPTYQFKTDVSQLDLKQAVESQMELFKNTLYGTASFKMEGNGASFNPDPAKQNLNAKGNLKVEKATFASIDIGKMVSEAITKNISDLGNRIPPLKSAKIPTPSSIESKYEIITSEFTVAKGTFNAPNFVAKSEPNKGFDLKGATTVGLQDDALKADWEIVDTHGLTQLRDVTVEQSGVRVERVFVDGKNAVHFPIRVTGTVFSPQFNYGAVPESLGKVALANLSTAVAQEAGKKVQEQIKQMNAPPEVQNALQGLGKKLFGN
jgi:AsmA protein